ncbi:MAG: RHS repeat-associated core domain-containing protein, partial [Candidatus Heimdallarchaeota archaeon]|nr:RHS repeat-associated core domain-containing protein [Candidatus Heimdallarchaeota archaeon]
SKESIKTIYSYDAFGQTRKEMGHVDNDFRFTGEQMDDETGLMYLRARYYDPDIGRFINKDPFVGFISDTQSLNRYSYVKNNPINSVDPLGLWEYSVGVALGVGLDAGISDKGWFYRPKMGIGLDLFMDYYNPNPIETGGKIDAGACLIRCSLPFSILDIPKGTPTTIVSTPSGEDAIGGDPVQLRVGVFAERSFSPRFWPSEDAGIIKRATNRKVKSIWENTKRKVTPPWEDMGVLWRATGRWMIPEAHSSELVMGK